MHTAAEIILKGKLNELEQKHIQDFAVNFIKKFGNENNYLNDVLLDVYYFRENYIDQFNRAFMDLINSL